MVIGLPTAFAIPRQQHQVLDAAEIHINRHRRVARPHHWTHEELLAIPFNSENHGCVFLVGRIIDANLRREAFRRAVAVNH